MIKVLERIKHYIRTFGPTPPEELIDKLHHAKPGAVEFTLNNALFARELTLDGLGNVHLTDAPKYVYEEIRVLRVADIQPREFSAGE